MFLKQIEGQEYTLNLDISIPEQKISALLIQENTAETQHSTTFNVPYSIFRQGLSGLQAIVRYLIEQKKLSYNEIATLLNRDQRTIWNTYKQTKNKTINKTIKEQNLEQQETQKIYFDLNNIKNRNIAILENICLDLKNKGYTLTESGLILNKSPKTIWTVLNRAQQKIRGDQK